MSPYLLLHQLGLRVNLCECNPMCVNSNYSNLAPEFSAYNAKFLTYERDRGRLHSTPIFPLIPKIYTEY